ncbi:beach-domain-containing protein [Hanseniaspora valbyensis NRRL Y-1626]|uniref:Beach-domain-containing protein n=1 Tax=Hanseniaspora valbyensis NRRL Y-1626 TaxID=766949 RepID=A0A1B7TIY3_9ASCO|nr:beach-domain-containing protein [Hanseniaspora valbyensis NRRL Y-1626]
MSEKESMFEFLLENILLLETKSNTIVPEALKHVINYEIHEIISEIQDKTLLDKNMFLHLMNEFVIKWDYSNIRSRENTKEEYLDLSWKEMFLQQNTDLIFLINNLINVSLFNKINLKNSLLMELIGDLKNQIKILDQHSTEYKHKYKLLLNLLEHAVKPFHITNNTENFDLLDLSIFADLHDTKKTDVGDFLLINDSFIKLHDNISINSCSVFLTFLCPNINCNTFTILKFKTDQKEILINISSNGLSIVENLCDVFEQKSDIKLLINEEFDINEYSLNLLCIEFVDHKIKIMINNEQNIYTRCKLDGNVSMSIGDVQTPHQNKAIILYDCAVFNDHKKLICKLDLDTLGNTTKNLSDYQNNKNGLFISKDKSLIIECYNSINFFNRIVYLIQSSNSDDFFKQILPILFYYKEQLLQYINLEESNNKRKSFYDIIFLNINLKIDKFGDIDFALTLIFDFIQSKDYIFEDYDFYKNVSQFIFNWKHLNKKHYLLIINKLHMFFELGNPENRIHNINWIENHIDILDSFFTHLDFLANKDIEINSAIYILLTSFLQSCFESFNNIITNHLLQYCIYKLSLKHESRLQLTEIIIESLINNIILFDKTDYNEFKPVFSDELTSSLITSCIKNSDTVPVLLFEKCFLLYLCINKLTDRSCKLFLKNSPPKLLGYALLLDEQGKDQYLKSFCKILFLGSFDIQHSSETAFIGCSVLEMFDSDRYWNHINKDFTELHLLLLKIMSTCLKNQNEFFIDRYCQLFNIMTMNKKYLIKVFENDCKVLMSLVSLSISLHETDNLKVNKCIANFFVQSIINLNFKNFAKIINILNQDNYDNTNVNFTKNTRVWISLEILPLVFKSLNSMDINKNCDTYVSNLKTICLVSSDVLLKFKTSNEFKINFLKCIFPLLESTNTDNGSIKLLIAKLLEIVCNKDNTLNENLMNLIIENQHLILSSEANMPYFIQFICFAILNYLLTNQMKEEKFAFINILLHTFMTNLKNNSVYAITAFILKDYNMKKLLEKLTLIESDFLIEQFVENETTFKKYLKKVGNEFIFEEPPLKHIIKQKRLSQQNDITLAQQIYKQENLNSCKIQRFILKAESKNKQIRKMDYQDAIESAEQNIKNNLSFLNILKTCFSTKISLQDNEMRMSLYRGFNKMMQRKILSPQNVNTGDKIDYDLFFSDYLTEEKQNFNENFMKEDIEKPALNGNDLLLLSNENITISQNRKILKKLSLNETIKNIWNVCIVTGVTIENGVLILTDSSILFYKQYYYRVDSSSIIKRCEMTAEEEGSLIALKFEDSDFKSDNEKAIGNLIQEDFIKIYKPDISFCLKRVFVFKDIACEFFNKYNKSYFFTFVNKNFRDKFYGEIHKSSFFNKTVEITDESNMFGNVFKSINLETSDIINKNGIGKFSFSSKISSVVQSLMSEDATLDSLAKDWQSGKISNFFYLMAINFYAGRSFNDITQYPIFPWVISDYESESLNLHDPKTFRDLKKPMGAQSSKRLANFVERYKAVEELNDERTPPFHYGTHYSSAMIVASYLIRLEPFTSSFKILQGGNFGPSDRIFNSIERTWESASKELTTDVRELIPEFYFLPDFLENVNNLDFGISQNGSTVNNVKLPGWCYNKSSVFIQKNMESLESDYVSENLNHWIDLIFGFKQRGKEAKEAVNVFNQLSYSGVAKIDDIVDKNEVELVTNIIHNFGQTPLQLFDMPHIEKDINYFNKNIITINTELKSFEPDKNIIPDYKDCQELVPITCVIKIDNNCYVVGNIFGVIKKKTNGKNKNNSRILFGKAHIKPITNLLYSENFDVLISLDSDGICLKWVLSSMDLINRLTFDICDNIILSNYSSNIIYKKQNNYILATFNGSILNDDVLADIGNVSIVEFADVATAVKKKLPHIIDYLLMVINFEIYLYEIVVNEKGEYILNKKETKINTEGKIPTKLEGLIILDDCNNNQLHLSLKFETKEDELIKWFEF